MAIYLKGKLLKSPTFGYNRPPSKNIILCESEAIAEREAKIHGGEVFRVEYEESPPLTQEKT